MLIIGILLIALAVLLFVAMIFAGTATVSMDFGWFSFDANPFVIYLLGAATVLLFIMGLELARSGTARSFRRRREVRSLKRENKRLEQEGASSTSSATGSSGSTGTSTTEEGTDTEGTTKA